MSLRDVRGYFERLANYAFDSRQGAEFVLANLHGEQSDFVRMNRGLVRQAGSVHQNYLTLTLVHDARSVRASTSLSGEWETDRARLDQMLRTQRESLPQIPEDPFLSLSEEIQSTEILGEQRVPNTKDALDEIRGSLHRTGGGDRDLVGILANGSIWHGFANSRGQRNWKDSWTYNFDWSIYHNTDKAVKCCYSGFEWDSAVFDRKMDDAQKQLDVIARAPLTIEPGAYRAYLAPAALRELMYMMARGGFSLRAHRTRTTPLLHLVDGRDQLNPAIHISENAADGLGPNFEPFGFMVPDRIPLIEGGKKADALTSPRSALEFDETTNGAFGDESPISIDVSPGTVPQAGALSTLQDGLYIGNLWYLNYSDRPACRTTGMTRFGTFWVEGGELKAPVNVMRFDESIYRALGSNLVGLTDEREFLIDPHSYRYRTPISCHLPGAIVDEFSFTL